MSQAQQAPTRLGGVVSQVPPEIFNTRRLRKITLFPAPDFVSDSVPQYQQTEKDRNQSQNLRREDARFHPARTRVWDIGVAPKNTRGQPMLAFWGPAVGSGTYEDPAVYYAYDPDNEERSSVTNQPNQDDSNAAQSLTWERRPLLHLDVQELAIRSRMKCVIIRRGPHDTRNKRPRGGGPTPQVWDEARLRWVNEQEKAPWHITVFMGDSLRRAYVQGHVFLRFVYDAGAGPHTNAQHLVDESRPACERWDLYLCHNTCAQTHTFPIGPLSSEAGELHASIEHSWQPGKTLNPRPQKGALPPLPEGPQTTVIPEDRDKADELVDPDVEVGAAEEDADGAMDMDMDEGDVGVAVNPSALVEIPDVQGGGGSGGGSVPGTGSNPNTFPTQPPPGLPFRGFNPALIPHDPAQMFYYQRPWLLHQQHPSPFEQPYYQQLYSHTAQEIWTPPPPGGSDAQHVQDQYQPVYQLPPQNFYINTFPPPPHLLQQSQQSPPQTPSYLQPPQDPSYPLSYEQYWTPPASGHGAPLPGAPPPPPPGFLPHHPPQQQTTTPRQQPARSLRQQQLQHAAVQGPTPPSTGPRRSPRHPGRSPPSGSGSSFVATAQLQSKQDQAAAAREAQRAERIREHARRLARMRELREQREQEEKERMWPKLGGPEGEVGTRRRNN